MFFPNRNDDFNTPTEPPSKRSKMRAPIFCLFPTEVEKKANEVCQVQRGVCSNLLAKRKNENKKSKDLFSRSKNPIVEKLIDENLSPILEAIARENSLFMRGFLANQIYEYIEKTAGCSQKLVVKSQTYCEEEQILKAGQIARGRRIFGKYEVKNINCSSRIF